MNETSLFTRIDNFVRGVANGATFGLADYMAGAANSALSGGGIAENMRHERQRSLHALNNSNAYAAGVLAGAYSMPVIGKTIYSGINGISSLAINAAPIIRREPTTQENSPDDSSPQILNASLKHDANINEITPPPAISSAAKRTQRSR
ncbi:MAG: hypothetical protein C0436_02895 [Alphaproteobacteria bacterium]|nr:hypothetical protein [Alphaproteobacteria bacterium]